MIVRSISASAERPGLFGSVFRLMNLGHGTRIGYSLTGPASLNFFVLLHYKEVVRWGAF